jgi:hypothetical protein
MAHIAHQPGPVCSEGVVSSWLVGVVGLGGWSCTRAAAVARGALLQFEHLSKMRGGTHRRHRPSAPVAGGYARGVWVSSPVPGRARGNKAVAFHNPQAFSNVQEEDHGCLRRRGRSAGPQLTPLNRFCRLVRKSFEQQSSRPNTQFWEFTIASSEYECFTALFDQRMRSTHNDSGQSISFCWFESW